MNTSRSTASPPPINWATRPNRRPPDSVNAPQNHAEESGAAASPLQVVEAIHIGNLQEALRRLSAPRRRQPKVVFQENANNIHNLDGRDDPCLDGRDPSSEVDDITLALSSLSTSTNSAPNHLNDPTTAMVTPATISRLSTSTNSAPNPSNNPPTAMVTAATISRLSTSGNSAPNHSNDPTSVMVTPATLLRLSASTNSTPNRSNDPTTTVVTPATLSRISNSTDSAPNHSNDPATAMVTPASGATRLGHPLTARTVPATIAVVSHGRRRYYVVVVGKCAGIYYDVWDNVEPLIRYVSDARHKGFPTFEKAVAYYLDAKRRNMVRIVRDPGDDDIYGPIHAAVQ